MAEEHRHAIKSLVTRVITRKSERDEQSMVGPSELGTACDYCLGLALTRAYPEHRPEGVRMPGGFGLKAWQGTAVHEKLERDVPRVPWHGAVIDQENKVTIYSLKHYGLITGHVDLVWRRDNYLAVVDFKTTDKAKLKGYRLNEVPDNYVFQLNLYGYGIEEMWCTAPKDIGIAFIPRDSNDPDDIWTCFAPYNRGVAELALARLEEVWEQVRTGHLMDLKSDSNCFNCGRGFW